MSDKELLRAWRGLLERYHSTASALERALNEQHQLGLSEFEVLDRLAESPAEKDECRVQELSARVHLSQSALSRVVARLERDGLVTRAMCAADRRGIYVHLTEAGRARHAAARPTQRAVLAAALPLGAREKPIPPARPRPRTSKR